MRERIGQLVTAGLFGVMSVVMVMTVPVSAAVVINEYDVPTPNSGSVHMALGPDGNIWFTEYSADKIGKINPATGNITEYTIPTVGARPWGIGAGPDGNVWFVENLGHKVGKITPGGVITEYSLGGNNNPSDITTGPDGNLWVTTVGGNSIVKMDTSGTILDSYPLGGAGKNPAGITAGPDGNLWFVENLGNAVGKITTSGVITEYPLPNGNSRAWQITVGPDDNLWFTQQDGNRIGKMTTGGTLIEYELPPGSSPWDITAGPDGNMWVTLNGSNKIAMIDMDGILVQSYDIPTPNSVAAGIAKDATNKVWFTEFSGKIGEVANITIPPYNDGDGIAESDEDAAPNSGDANDDGLPDGRQAYVASFLDAQTGKYISLEVANACQLSGVSSTASTQLANDGTYSYPHGMLNFTANCGTPGYVTSVKIYFYGADQEKQFVVRKYNTTTHTYAEVSGAQLSHVSIGGMTAVLAEYQVTDGGALDEDGLANGVIVDPVGLALASSTQESLANTGMSQPFIVTLVVSTMGIAGTALIVYRKREL